MNTDPELSGATRLFRAARRGWDELRTHRGWDEVRKRLDADRALQGAMAGYIQAAEIRYPLDRGAEWKPGIPLKLLFAGYTGTRNTGADVRVEEMIRQVRHLFGDEHVDLSILSIDPALSRGYFRTVKQVQLPHVFPQFLFREVHKVHGVIACEGSMFKSRFANALSTMMVGALGLACAERKLAVGYGGEAGAMDPSLEALVRRYCRDAIVIARNEESKRILVRLGVQCEAGTDTAWTFSPAPPEVGRRVLESAGWDGRAPILAIAPIHAFWWPVRPDVRKAVAHRLTGSYADAHYKSLYFHRSGPDVDRKQQAYIEAIASAVRRVGSKKPAPFVILIGMEQLDRRACEQLREALGGAPPMFVSDQLDMYTMVSVLRQASMLVASRYHALVTSMPAGVVSVGITMDERIRNLMADRGHPDLALEVDDPLLAERLYEKLTYLERHRQAVREDIVRCVGKNLERMGEMGRHLVEATRRHYPEFPFRSGLGFEGTARAHLPPLCRDLEALWERREARPQDPSRWVEAQP